MSIRLSTDAHDSIEEGPLAGGLSLSPSSPQVQGTPDPVRFIERDSVISVLEIDVSNHRDFMAHAYRILFELRVQVVSAAICPRGRRRLYRLRLVEFDGQELDDRRWRQIERELGSLASILE